MAALQLPGGPLRLHIPRQECRQAGLDAATPLAVEQPLACSLSVSVDNSTLEATTGAGLASDGVDLCSKQPATTTAAGPPAAAAPVTLIARQRPRKLASPAASSPTSSSAAKSAFRPSVACGAADAVDAAAPLLRRRCVLVAKQLTNSDASSGRIILPRVAVESNLSFVLGYRHYALAVKDCNGRRYEFMIKSWANGTEHRRVFVLEQVADFLRSHGIGVGDAVGICTDESGELVVEANTEEVRQATVSPKYGALALAAPPPGATAAVPLAAGASGRCIRSPHCTKAAGHPGFCSGPKAAAAAAAKQHRSAAAHHASHARHAHHHSAHACQPGTSDASARGAAAGSGSSGEEAATRLATPRAAASRQAAITSTAEFASAAAAAGAALPSSLGLAPHDIAAIPAGLRIVKPLTAYDLSSRRVVMPAPEVEAGVHNAGATDLLTLAAVDEGQRWVFPTLRAWTNVAARRGYLLDGLADWLANRGAREGDCLVVSRDSDASPPRLELLPSGALAGSAPKQPAMPETAAPTFSVLPLLLHPIHQQPGRGLVLLTQRRGAAGGMCSKTATCTKPAGHQGFCSGHKGFKRRESPTASCALGGRRAFGRHRPCDDDWLSDDDAYLTASDDDSSPTFSVRSRAAKRPRRGAALAAAAVVAAAASRDVSPTPPPAAPAGFDPLLSLLTAADAAAVPAPNGTALVATAAAAAEQAALSAEAAAHAAYGAAKLELMTA
ncbi:hypothetical protein ABPG75_011378 [Micractinium tetrahymenae]